jgi:hypothetical protein
VSHLDYLKAANIAPIKIETREETGFTILVGRGQMYDDQSVWVDARHRGRLIRRATRMAGEHADRESVIAALNEAAKFYNVKLSAHLIVIARAMRLSQQLDNVLAEMKTNGTLKFFHQEYAKLRRERGEMGLGFMNFATAQRRFRNAIIARLVSDSSQVTDSRLITRVLTGREPDKINDPL